VDATEVVRQVAIGHAQERARTDRLTREVLDKSTQLTRDHTEAVRENAKETRERDREFHKESMERISGFMDSVVERMRASHEADMERLKEERAHERERAREDREREREEREQRHQHLLELMVSSKDRELELTKIAIEAQQGDDSEPWEKAGKLALEGVKEIRGLASESRRRGARRRLPGEPRRLPKGKRPDGASDDASDDNPESKREPTVRSREMARRIASLKRTCDIRGIDFEQFLSHAQDSIEQAPDEPATTEAPTPEADEGVGQENT
jgi:hypothetical protein